MRRWLAITMILSGSLAHGGIQEVFDPLDPTDDDAQTGIEIGAAIPDFTASDQNGARLGFDDIKGPNGAVLVFHRSADW